MIIKYKKLHSSAKVPTLGSPGAAGADLTCTRISIDTLKNSVTYHTDLAVQLPKHTYLDLRARSSISKVEWVLANGAGVIDSDYTGEIKVVFRPVNPDVDIRDEVLYRVGDKIAQVLLIKYQVQEYKEVEELADTERGDGGFGSTDAKEDT
jgi:dUTP pyrophosphatase